jgi:hypothetical protein
MLTKNHEPTNELVLSHHLVQPHVAIIKFLVWQQIIMPQPGLISNMHVIRIID